jgi:hypothetical protein
MIDDFMAEVIAIIIMFSLLIGLGLVCDSCAEKEDIAVWNNGYHEDCGGRWEYEQAVGHRYGTNYIYVCDKCGTRYEFDDLR